MTEMGHTETLDREVDDEGGGLSQAALLYVALRCGKPATGASRHILTDVDEVRLGRGRQLGATRETIDGKRTLLIALPDRSVSSDHARLSRNGAVFALSDRGSKNGTVVDGVTTETVTLNDGSLIEVGEMVLVYRNPVMVTDGDPLDLHSSELSQEPEGFVTLVPRLTRSFDDIRKIARSTLSLLISGESGTGKEIVARGVHILSERSGAFVAVNCGALTDSLLQSQLFGYKKGAFSGADEDRSGLIEASSGGTLFLDEIAELSPRAQAALLRVLQEKEVLQVGATTPLSVDLRLVSATHRDLERWVAEEKFREDLYARISGLSIRLPPLRERREDLGVLVDSLLARDGGRARGITVRAARSMFRYHWPRNIRQLDNCLHGAGTLADGGVIGSEHLSPELRTGPDGGMPPPQVGHSRSMSDEDRALRGQLLSLMQSHQGNVTRVADVMGKKRQQIQKWCKRLGIDPSDYR